MNSEKIKELAEQSGFHFYDLHNIDGQNLGETVEADSWSAIDKFADLVTKNINSEAVRLIHIIANDYYELSHEKIKWQRDDHMKLCRRFLKTYIENDDERKN